jgi:hypothetical protein
MTDGGRWHKHRMLHVKSLDAWWIVNWLQFPLIHKPARTTREWRKVENSPYPYGPCYPTMGLESPCWVLTPLGILHRWTGLTLTDAPRPIKHKHHCGDGTCEEAHP